MGNKMSSDRVRFEWDTHGRTSDSAQVEKLFWLSFGMSSYDYRKMTRNHPDGWSVVCRPSQFARFLIFRNQLGMRNGFKELNPVLFQMQKDNPSVIEVWSNAAPDYCCEDFD